jgi:hypothetical protein
MSFGEVDAAAREALRGKPGLHRTANPVKHVKTLFVGTHEEFARHSGFSDEDLEKQAERAKRFHGKDNLKELGVL